jgi:ABC-2 type transport system ATP-binding protein
MPEESQQPNSQQVMIEAHDLTKHYGNFAAAEKVSFAIPKGEVAGFLGPNGAGKSTTMKMLSGYLAPTSGYAKIGRHNVASDRLKAVNLLGYLPENGPLYTEMTPASFLRNIGQARGMSRDLLAGRLEFVADRCDLKSVWGKVIGKLSKGFRQRVGMAQALLHDPDVLILDEPTSGLDPNQVVGVRELILSLGEHKTILLSTHILQEVAAVCSRVILINNGRIILDGSTSEMGSSVEEMENCFHTLTEANLSSVQAR